MHRNRQQHILTDQRPELDVPVLRDDQIGVHRAIRRVIKEVLKLDSEGEGDIGQTTYTIAFDFRS
jgi:hypothetical protein